MSSIVADGWSRRLFAVAALALACVAQDESPPKIDGFHFKGTTLGGRALDQDSLRDHVVIVDLWGTWCGPCREAVPVLVDLYGKYKQQGLEIVGFGFAADGSAEDVDKVRRFAAEKHITYELLPGDAAVRDQVPGFSGYPTMLLFDRGWKHATTHVGFAEDLAKTLETWVRSALKLDGNAAAAAAAGEAKEEVPEGRLFEPGNGDRGFAIEATAVDGSKVATAELRGAPLLLAVTTSWDATTATRTAKLLQSIATQHPRLHVLAWHVEGKPDAERRQQNVRTFLAANGATYTAFVTGLKDVRAKLHRFAALPTLLLFDAEGVLVEREGGLSDEIEQRLATKLDELLRTK